MAIRTNIELANLLNAAQTQYEQVRVLNTALTATKRIKAKRTADASVPVHKVWDTGVLFRDVGLFGELEFKDAQIISFGVTYNLVVSLAADLTTGKSVMRIEGGGHWIEGTIGLANADFIVPSNPTASNSLALGETFKIKASTLLPDGTPDSIPPVVLVGTSQANVLEPSPVVITADPSDNDVVAKVEFYRDGFLLGSKTEAPWTYTDNIVYENIGDRMYYAVAYDATGNKATSPASKVTVNIPEPFETGPEVAINSVVTDVTFENTTASAQTNVPVTFGQAFKIGAIPNTNAGLELRTAGGSVVPCQMNVKNSHKDGSVRHAIISAILPSLDASASTTLTMVRKGAVTPTAPLAPSNFSSVSSVVSIVDNGVTYQASLATLLAAKNTVWLAGDTVGEWCASGPLLSTVDGAEHPHVHVRFNLRGYKGLPNARVDITIENTWAWNTAPQDVVYDLTITVNGTSRYTKTGLVHHPRTRYRNVFWTNTEPAVHIKHNIPYLLSTKAVPNYDTSVVPDEGTITRYKGTIDSNGSPMANGIAQRGMGTTGGRPDMGVLPGWTALYLLSMNKNSKFVSLRQGELGGSWSIHFRDKNTDRVLSLQDWPYFSTIGTSGDSYNPVTKKSERAPSTVSNSNSNVADVAHHPDFAFVPYLVTGDLYFLEELQFWAMHCILTQNPARTYRDGARGLVKPDQLRGQGWGMRTFAHAAYISPTDYGQAEFDRILRSNVKYYDDTFTNNAEMKLGVIPMTNYTIKEGDGYLGMAPWQDDHFTSSIGRAVELGFVFAKPLFMYKARFTTARLYGPPGTCWIQGSSYRIQIMDTSRRVFQSYKQCYDATFSPEIIAAAEEGFCGTQKMADAWANMNTWASQNGVAGHDGVQSKIIAGDMSGYSETNAGYPSCLQPAAAYCATHNVTNGVNAWEVFDGRTVKPTYKESPQFAIVPRK